LTLAPGSRLGPYEILSAIGAGGMGEVYRARDTRLERTVAVKVLPEHLTSDADLRQRFEREAKTISQRIFYRAADQKLMAVDVEAGETFKAGIPQALFPARVQPGIARNKYVVSADGARFLFVAPLGREALTPTTVVLNWSAELGR
jgi:serine/threonine protein kinase